VLLIVAGVLVLGLVWWLAPWHGATPVMITGLASPNATRPPSGSPPTRDSRPPGAGDLSPDGEGVVIAGVPWTDATDTWQQGPPPSCLAGLAEIEDPPATPVELRFVRVRGEDGPWVVTSLHCRS
jgi:hypothetical protein